jgi:signal transduction histidine kinase
LPGLAPAPRAWRFDRSSLRWRLSWLLLITAVLTVTAFGLFAYRAARTTNLEAAHTRLRSALVQLNSLTDTAVNNLIESMRTVANDPAIIDALKNPGQPLSPAALAALRKFQGPTPQTAIVELRGADGALLFTVGGGDKPSHSTRPFEFPDKPVIGPMYDFASAPSFDGDVTVTAGGVRLGGVRRTVRIGGAVNRRLTASLLGEQAALLLGNQDGLMWDDKGQISYPAANGPEQTYTRANQKWVSDSAPIANTPWMYVVEMPERVALASARALLTPFVIVGLAIALLGAIAGLRASKKITAPLAELTAATEAIARGDRDVKLTALDRHDEIGRLARSFATMATSVATVRDRLESDVDARTGELTQAVGRLRELDEELQRSERFATIGRLSGSVGHELRNPLSVMSSVVFLLDAMPDASPKLKDYSSLLREQIRLSERIISDLLDRARHSAPVRHTVDIPTFLDDLIARAGIPPTVSVEKQYPRSMPQVIVDRDHVGQIIWNLITNAVQAMHSQGSLKVDAVLADDRLRIEVRDSGPGISAADAERVFEPLYTTKAQGVGLGLSVSRAYARSNGGDLYVSQTGGAGACFVLDLPAQRAGLASSSASAS